MQVRHGLCSRIRSHTVTPAVTPHTLSCRTLAGRAFFNSRAILTMIRGKWSAPVIGSFALHRHLNQTVGCVNDFILHCLPPDLQRTYGDRIRGTQVVIGRLCVPRSSFRISMHARLLAPRAPLTEISGQST